MSERRQLIIEAAAREIARNGVRGLRIENLAAEAGVSVSLTYYHFGGRAGLLRRTLEHIDDRVEAYIADAWNAVADPRAELRVQAAGLGSPKADPEAVAGRLTSLVEGLSERWLSGVTPADRAQYLLRAAVAVELDER